MKTVHALLVYPSFSPTFWSFKYALDFVGKKSNMPPLGLLTVAALFPREGYALRVVDMNVRSLEDADLAWADVVMTSTMAIQKSSLYEVIRRCNAAGKPIVLGGPHPTSYHQEISDECGGRVDHFCLGEVEETFPAFLKELSAGGAEPFYPPPVRPDVSRSPVPRFDLIDRDDYGMMAVQFSRGCPFDCEFCDITKLFGRVPRTKSSAQMLAEFDELYRLGWRGGLFIVDDNFIGNKKEAMRLLADVAVWQKERGYPFRLFTEASVNLEKMDDLMDLMVESGFNMVFLGIESPNPEALVKTKKKQNTKRGQDDYLLRAVRKIQGKGLEVTGGFILGLDGDGPEVFDAQIEFVQEAGIPVAMVGLLNSLKGTNLETRLIREGRLVSRTTTGDQFSTFLNYRPEIDPAVLVEGYKRVLDTLYDRSYRNYYARCLRLLKSLKRTPHLGRRVGRAEVRGFFLGLFKLVFSRQGFSHLSYLARVLIARPRLFFFAFRLSLCGYHFRKITEQTLALDAFRVELEESLSALRNGRSPEEALGRARRRLRFLPKEFRPLAQDAHDRFIDQVRRSSGLKVV